MSFPFLQVRMTMLPLPSLLLQVRIRMLTAYRQLWRRIISNCLLTLVVAISCLLLLGTPSALAGFNDDKFDGNIFALYGGNGSLVPPRVTLADSLQKGKPALLVFYVDDSKDCKQYATVVSYLQSFYGRVADIIPLSVDTLPDKSTYTREEAGYYYKSGFVPQTVLINQKGKVVLDEKGRIPFEQVDDVFREVFNLLPRSESPELKQRAFNEINTELSH